MPHSRKASNSSLRVLRQSGADGSFGLRECEEGRGVLLHQAVQRGLLGAVTLVVERAANGRPVGLPTGGLHALLTIRLWCCTVSDRADAIAQRDATKCVLNLSDQRLGKMPTHRTLLGLANR